MIYVLLIPVALLLLFWIAGFIYANDFSVPTMTGLSQYKKVLVVYPHADDEVLTCSGLMSQLSQQHAAVVWVVLTKGERGVEGAELQESLKSVRVQEAERAAQHYGVRKIIQGDFPDNDVSRYRQELQATLTKVLDEYQPDLVITYDLTGLYGHPDHVVISEVLTDLLAEKSETTLWYASISERRLNAIRLPEHMAKDPEFKSCRVFPTHKVFIGVPNLYTKIAALYEYRSQLFAFKKSVPVSQLPLWFYTSMMPYEYFHEVQ